MPNLSSVVNYFATPNEGFATTLGSTISSGAVTVPLAGTSGLTNGSIFVGIIEPGATNQQVFTGIVDTGGSQITSVVWTRGVNNSHVGGVSIVDYVTGTAFGMLSKGMLVEHNQNGTHGAITSTNATLTTPSLVSPTIKGSFDGWIGANESWTYASATTITVPTDATTKYAVGDMVKFTQSATVKHFVIVSLNSTTLTVTGLSGATVANAAISLNYYSKTRNPGVSLGGAPVFNPYKFSVYRSTNYSSTQSAWSKVQLDTKTFDTGANFDTATNFRFTASIAGFYFITGAVALNIAVNIITQAALYKNGNTLYQGPAAVNNAGGVSNISAGVSNLVQLAANDYIELWSFNSQGTSPTLQGSSVNTYFSGLLVSAT